MTQRPNFTIRPETRALNVTKDHQTQIRFLVSSRTYLRGEAHVIPVAYNGDHSPEAVARFRNWLTLIGEREVDFDASGEAKPYTVQIRLPSDAEPGEYRFRLKVVDVAEPDETVGESPEITFQVVGPKPTLAAFILAAILALGILTALAVWAVIFVQNRTNLQLSIEPLSATKVQAGATANYIVTVQNQRKSPVTGVRLRYTMPEGIKGGHATVTGAITRHCDKNIGKPTIILCDLGTLVDNQREEIRFTLIPDPDGPPNSYESETVDDGNSGLWAQLRRFFTGDTTKVQRNLAGYIQNQFELSGNEISDRTESRQLTIERCLSVDVKQGNSVVKRDNCLDGNPTLRLSIDPAITEAALNEIQPYTIRVWNENSVKEATDVIIRYQLPERLRYVGDSRTPTLLPTTAAQNDYQCALEEYFTVACRLNAVLPAATQSLTASIPVQEIVLQLASTSAGAIDNVVTVEGIFSQTVVVEGNNGLTTTQVVREPIEPVRADVTTKNLNTALRFDGIDDWVELDYAPGLPNEFTVELWIHPFSSDNGQSFVGAHMQDGQNLFLVGYWPERDSGNDGLVVNILDDDQIMLAEKPTTPYHLAITVKQDSKELEKYTAILYLHDMEGNTLIPSKPREFIGKLPTTETTSNETPYRNWVLGQEWDQGSPTPRTSDFFKGTMSDVRIWDKALNEKQIICVWDNRIYANQVGTVDLDCLNPDKNSAETEAPRLAGYWRLDVPNTPTGDHVANLVSTTEQGDEQPQGAQLYGGVGWGGIDPRFGTGLLFDGSNDFVQGDRTTGIISFTVPTDGVTSTVLLEPSIIALTVSTNKNTNENTNENTNNGLVDGMLLNEVTTNVPVIEAAINAPLNADTTNADTTNADTTVATAAPTTTVAAAVEEPEARSLLTTTRVITDGISASIATWLYVADGIPTERQWIAGVVGNSAVGENQTSVALMVDENGQVVFIAQCNGQTSQVRDTKAVPINRWVHYAAAFTLDCNTIANSVLTIYRDGAAQGQVDNTPMAPLPWAGCQANVYLGGLPLQNSTVAGVRAVVTESVEESECLNNWPFQGQLDDTRVWARHLSADEIRRWRNRPREFYDEVAYWPFDEQVGNKSRSSTGDPYQLTLVGPKWIDTNFDLAGQDTGP